MRKSSLAALSITTALAASMGMAKADPSLSIEAFSGSTPIAVTSASFAPGVLSSFGSIASGPFISFSATTTGLPLTSGLSVANISSSAAAGAILTLVVTQQGLTSPSSAIPFSYVFTATSASGGSASYADYIDPTDGVFDLSSADLIASGTLPFTGSPASSSGVGTASGIGGTYSETEEIQIDFASAGSNTTSSSLSMPVGTPVPEPASIALLGSGLLGLAGFIRRKRS